MARTYILRPSLAPGATESCSSLKTSVPLGKRPLSSSSGTADAAPWLVNCAISERKKSQVRENATSSFLQFAYDSAPVVGYRVLKNDVVTVRRARYPEDLSARLEDCERGKIERLSMKSRRRLALVAGNSPVTFRSFVTVTYPAAFPCDGKQVKRHLHALLAGLRRKTGGMSYLWFLEFQKREAPHFHIFMDTALPEPLSPMNRRSGRVRKSVMVHWPWQHWLSALWFKIVGSGDERHLKAGASWEVIECPDGAARYVAKESYKTFQKNVPANFQNVGRFWGTSKDVPPDEPPLVLATLADMRATFQPECFDDNGNPYPVLFGGGKFARKVIAKPARIADKRPWKIRNSKIEDQSCLSLPVASSAPSPKPKKNRIGFYAND